MIFFCSILVTDDKNGKNLNYLQEKNKCKKISKNQKNWGN